MNSNSNFNISVGRIGRTLIYEDSTGKLIFTYDADTSKGQNKIILYEKPMTGDFKPLSLPLSEADIARVKLAGNRIKEYLLSRGYQI